MNIFESGFVKTLRKSVAELIDEVMTFISFLAAIVCGIYFNSWIIFFALLVAGFGISTAINKLIVKSKKDG